MALCGRREDTAVSARRRGRRPPAMRCDAAGTIGACRSRSGCPKRRSRRMTARPRPWPRLQRGALAPPAWRRQRALALGMLGLALRQRRGRRRWRQRPTVDPPAQPCAASSRRSRRIDSSATAKRSVSSAATTRPCSRRRCRIACYRSCGSVSRSPLRAPRRRRAAAAAPARPAPRATPRHRETAAHACRWQPRPGHCAAHRR